jgi:hypothetical protein
VISTAEAAVVVEVAVVVKVGIGVGVTVGVIVIVVEVVLVVVAGALWEVPGLLRPMGDGIVLWCVAGRPTDSRLFLLRAEEGVFTSVFVGSDGGGGGGSDVAATATAAAAALALGEDEVW